MSTPNTNPGQTSHANAQRSTGPKTPHGKARSARNALKHGFSGKSTSLLPEDQALLNARITAWVHEFHAHGDTERTLVADAAAASVRIHRIDLTLAEIARKRLDAARKRQATTLDRKLQHAEVELALAYAVRSQFEVNYGYLTDEGFAMLSRLLEDHPKRPSQDLIRARSTYARLRANRSAEEVAWARGELTSWLMGLERKAQRIVNECRAAQAAKPAEPVLAIGDGWFDTSKRSELLRRYRTESERTLQRALVNLQRFRKLAESPFEDEEVIEGELFEAVAYVEADPTTTTTIAEPTTPPVAEPPPPAEPPEPPPSLAPAPAESSWVARPPLPEPVGPFPVDLPLKTRWTRNEAGTLGSTKGSVQLHDEIDPFAELLERSRRGRGQRSGRPPRTPPRPGGPAPGG